MAQLIVRNLDEGVKQRLRRRAQRNGHSTEEEVRDILSNAVKAGEVISTRPLGTRLKARFARVGLSREIPELRGQIAHPADLSS